MLHEWTYVGYRIAVKGKRCEKFERALKRQMWEIDWDVRFPVLEKNQLQPEKKLRGPK